MTDINILGNIERKSKVDVNLYKRLNEAYNSPMIENTLNPETTKSIEDIIVPSKNNASQKKIYYNSEGMPKVLLTPIEKTAVNIPTQKDYDILMQVYEAGDWMWNKGYLRTSRLPTSRNRWKNNSSCVDAGISGMSYFVELEKEFSRNSRKFYHLNNWNIISTQEFYNIQKISQDTIKELNEWYDKNHPNRVSKG